MRKMALGACPSDGASRVTAILLAVAAALHWAAPAPLEAQDVAATGDPRAALDSLGLVDRIVAIVSDTAILQSEVEEEILRLQAQGVDVPPRGGPGFEAAFRQILSSMVDRMILLDRAKRMPELAVADEEVEELVEERFQQVRSGFPSDEALMQEVEATGMNMFQYRQMLRAQARSELLLNRFRRSLAVSGRLPPVSISEEEIREYFQRFAVGQTRPATVSFERIVVDPEPVPEAEDSARAVARRALQEVLDGTEFEVAARRHSQDEGSRAQGGDLGWLRRNDVVPAFGDVAWAAPLGRPVGPVRTRFGFHVIRVENVRGGERSLRHILIRPLITPEDVERAREKAEALADSLRAGADARRLAERHALADEEIRFDNVEVDQLGNRFGPEVARRLARPSPGEVLGPFPAAGPAGETNFVIVRVREYRAEGRFELEDVRENIRERLLEDKQFARYLEQLRHETYVEIIL